MHKLDWFKGVYIFFWIELALHYLIPYSFSLVNLDFGTYLKIEEIELKLVNIILIDRWQPFLIDIFLIDFS